MSPAVPHALDASWLTRHLPRHLGAPVREIEIRHVWETPRHLTVLYRIDLPDATGGVSRQIYAGHRFSPAHIETAFRDLAERATVKPPIGPPAAMVPEAGLVLLAFPNDRKLAPVSRNELEAWLVEYGANRSGERSARRPTAVRDARVDVLRYVPAKRLTLRFGGRLVDAAGGRRTASLVVKQLNDTSTARRLYEDVQTLEQLFAGDSEPIRIPRALGCEPSRALIFLEDLPGVNLQDVLLRDPQKTLARDAGELLAQFHRASPREFKRVTVSNELEESREAVDLLIRELPRLRSRLDAWMTALESRVTSVDPPEVLLHGSYRLNHLLLHDRRLSILDLGSLRVGSAAYDIANLLSSLYYLEAQRALDLATRRVIASGFVEGYLTRSSHAVRPADVLWFLASLLMNKQASKYLRHRHADRSAKIERILSWGEASLSACDRLHAHADLASAAEVLP